MNKSYSAAILIVSDRVSMGVSVDTTGVQLAKLLNRYNIYDIKTVPDDIIQIQKQIKIWTNSDLLDLIITTGGTGFASRDVTPEAISPLLDIHAPGIIHLMLSSSLQITPLAALSRPVCGIISKTIILTLPGSTKGATENLSAVLDILEHAIDLVKGSLQKTEKKHMDMSILQNNVHVCKHDDYTNDQVDLKYLDSSDVAHRHRKSPFPLVSFDDAYQLVIEQAHQLQSEIKNVDFSILGYCLSENVISQQNIPQVPSSFVDGYAVISSDGPGEYKVISSSIAGKNNHTVLEKGFVSRITTGAPVPAGADAIVMVESTELIFANGSHEELVLIKEHVLPGQDIRKTGSDIYINECVLEIGCALTPSEIGLLNSIGCKSVSVNRKPVISVLSTGNEVIDMGCSTSSSSIYDSNRPSLLSALYSLKYPCIDAGIVKDEYSSIKSKLLETLEKCDVLITTGGVSMGELDLIKPILLDIGAKIHFGRVLLKPGKPTTFATIFLNGKKKLIFGLPGNPVSALVCFYLFVVPALSKMSGFDYNLPMIKVKLGHSMELDKHRPEFRRVNVKVVNSEFIANATGKQQSSRLLSMKSANGLLKLPAGDYSIEEGDLVDCILIGGF